MPLNLVWLRIVKSAASLSRVIELLVLPSNQQAAAALIDVETQNIPGLLSIAFVNVGYRGLQGAELITPCEFDAQRTGHYFEFQFQAIDQPAALAFMKSLLDDSNAMRSVICTTRIARSGRTL
jgi:hypothetical protein